MDTYVLDEPDAFVFTTPSGSTIWRGNFNKLVDWAKTVASIGAAELHWGWSACQVGVMAR